MGAGQTIDQLRALGAVSRWTVELDLGDASPARERWVRSTACRAVAASLTQHRPGPVQLNIPLREPLTSASPAAPLTLGRPGARRGWRCARSSRWMRPPSMRWPSRSLAPAAA